MPAGIIIRNPQNQITMDTTTRMGRILGFANILTTANGSVSPAGANTGTLFGVVFNVGGIPAYNTELHQPTITTTATTISWSWGSLASNRRRPLMLVYGVY